MPAPSPIYATAAETQRLLYSCLPTSPEQAVALILKRCGRAHPGALWPRIQSPRCRCLCPDGARGGCGSPLTQHRAAAAAPTPTHEQVERFGWRFAPADKVMQVAKRLREGGIQRAIVGHGGGNNRCRLPAKTDGALPSGEIREQRRPRRWTYGWVNSNNLVPCLRLHDSTRARQRILPRCGSSPCSPSTTHAAGASGVHRHHPRQAAGWLLVGQKKKANWRLAVEEPPGGRPWRYTKSWRSGSADQLAWPGRRRRILATSFSRSCNRL